jgi:hypothetical protein
LLHLQRTVRLRPQGWVDLEFEGGESIHLAASESIFISEGVRHNELCTSDDHRGLVSPTSNQATKLVEHRCERGLARPFVAVGEITRRRYGGGYRFCAASKQRS